MHVKIAAGAPRANGQVERLNSVITNCLTATSDNEEKIDWDDMLYQVQWAINSTVHKVTKRAPNKVIFNYNFRNLINNTLIDEIESVNDLLGTENEKEKISELLEANREKLRERFDKNRKEAVVYEPNDIVLLKRKIPATGESKKLEQKNQGPYEVVKALGNDRYLIQDIEGEQQSGRIFKGIIPVDRLKKVPTDKDVKSNAKNVIDNFGDEDVDLSE